jgi:hypothetical protein
MAGWRTYLPMQALWPAAQPLIADLRQQAHCTVDARHDADAKHFLLYRTDGEPVAYARLCDDGTMDSLCIVHDASADTATDIMDIGAVLLGYAATQTASDHPWLRITPPPGWRHLLGLLDPAARVEDHALLLDARYVADHWRLAGLHEARLGQTGIYWELIKSQEIADTIVRMTQQAEHHLRIYSPVLNHAIFDNAHLAEAVSALARRSRYTDVRVLIVDPRPLTQRGHALLNLHRRLSSVVPILKLPYGTDELTDTVVIADDCGVVAKSKDDDGNVFACFNQRPQARALIEKFDYLWHRAVTDPEIRGLAL